MEDENLVQLKTIYDELWHDARTLIKDMSSMIRSVYLVGFFVFWGASMQLLSIHQLYMKILGGSTRVLDYFYIVAISLAVVGLVVGGIFTIRRYNELKNRYARVLELEKGLED